MCSKYHKDFYFRIATFYLKNAGFWFASNRIERWFRSTMVTFTAFSLIFSFIVHVRNIYFYRDNLMMWSGYLCNALIQFSNSFKVITISIYKKKFFSLIAFIQNDVFRSNYNQYERTIIADTAKTCSYLICAFVFFCESTISSYVVTAVTTNIGKNETDRILVFDMWVDLLILSPYFEIIFTIQSVTLYQSGVIFLCFDNILYIICLHLASQFRILQYRMSGVSKLKEEMMEVEDLKTVSSEEYYTTFKNCVRQHKTLTEFCDMVDEVYRAILLAQVFTFTMLLCFVGYQLFLVPDIPPTFRVGLVCYLLTDMSQLWLFTYSCNCVTEESLNVAEAIYSGPWIHLPEDKYGRMIRKDLQMIIMRSRRPSCLTAWGFFPISLETYTSIMSSAMSYFTLLKQRGVE